MKTFNDIKEGDRVYTISFDKLISHPIVREDEFDVVTELLTEGIKFVIPRSEDTYYYGVYSCIEAIMKHLSDGI